MTSVDSKLLGSVTSGATFDAEYSPYISHRDNAPSGGGTGSGGAATGDYSQYAVVSRHVKRYDFSLGWEAIHFVFPF